MNSSKRKEHVIYQWKINRWYRILFLLLDIEVWSAISFLVQALKRLISSPDSEQWSGHMIALGTITGSNPHRSSSCKRAKRKRSSCAQRSFPGLALAIATPSIRVCSAHAIPAPHRPLALFLAHAAHGPFIGSVMRIDGPIICTIDQTPEREGTRMSTSHSSHS